MLIAGALLAVGLAASLAAPRLRVPGLVLFLGIGMAVGSEGLGWISFDNYDLARSVGIVALALILFEGGLAAGFDEIRPVLGTWIGLAAGLVIGWLAVRGLQRTRLASTGLYPVASLAAAALAYGLADVAHGSGFLAVYLTGLWLGSSSIPAKRTITAFHDGLAWLAQLTMFLTLGLLGFPSQLGDAAVEGTVLAVVVAVVARPLGVALATLFSGYTGRERLVLGWAGLRGAVPVVLATFPVIRGIPDSVRFFDIVFFAVVLSTLLQGTTFEPLARLLKVTSAVAALPRPLAETGTIRGLGAEVAEYPVGRADAIVGLRVRELGMPRDALLNVIVRGDQAIPPRGSTRIEAGDRLHVLVRQEAAISFTRLLERWHAGPIGRPHRRRRAITGTQPVHTVRPWSERSDGGEQGHPARLGGVAVMDQIRTRRDGHPGALVMLEDGRYGVSGEAGGIRGANHRGGAGRGQSRPAGTDAQRAWGRAGGGGR